MRSGLQEMEAVYGETYQLCMSLCLGRMGIIKKS